MNFKDILLPLGLAMVTVWGLNYFFSPRDEAKNSVGATSGKTFIAPKERQEFIPLNKEVDFVDARATGVPVVTEVETNHAVYQFSTEGATLDRIEFKRQRGDQFVTLFPAAESEREQRCFLVALPEKTPYFYTLIDHKVLENRHELSYQAETDLVVIQKKYVLYTDTYKIDLVLQVTSKKMDNTSVLVPRIFFPAPMLPDIAKHDIISAIYNNEKGAIEKTKKASLNVQQGWLAPTLFGLEDKYFVHAMIADPTSFVRRAYYAMSDKAVLNAIIEGPAITEAKSWTVSFYFGPKEQEAFALVDKRLEQTLDYSGIFWGPISWALLFLLKLLYAYVHNYGLAIILLTFLIKLVLLPFTFRGDRDLKKRTEFDKKLRYIQQKYKDDPDTLAQERAELVKKHGMPGLSGCLPLLLQLPIFIALSRVLSGSIELYRAPLCCWIQDLSVPDPYYVLPIILVLATVIQALTADKSQRFSMLAMALIFGAVTANLAAGLALYILMNSVLTVLQTYFVGKMRTR